MKVPYKIIKISGIILVSIATLITATALFLPYLLDVNAYRTEIITALQQSLKRQVTFGSGSFVWHFGPSFKFKSFIVKERVGTADFISARQITVQLALLPLLEKKVELRKVSLDETTVSLVRNSDGTTNIDDILKPAKDDSVQINFKQIRINKGAILWNDLACGKTPITVALRNISLVADNLGRNTKGHLKLSGTVQALSGSPTQINIKTSLHIPNAGETLLNTIVDGDVSLKQLEIGRFWPYFGSFIPFDNTGGRINLATSFKGKPQDFNAKGKILINGATVNWPTVFHAKLSPKSLYLDFTLALNKQQINISALDLGMAGFRIKGDFLIRDYLSKDPLIITRASTPSTFRYEDVRDYVPYGIIESGTSDYIENKIKTGIFKLDTGVLEGRVSQIAHMEIGQNCNTLLIRGPVEKAVLSYGPKAPTFNNLKGTVELKGKNFNLIGMTGNFGTSPFSLDGSITEYNTDKPADYPIRMDISPRAPEIAWLVNLAGIPKLEYSNSSSLHLTGNGHYSAFKLNGDWDLKQAAYVLPGYVSKSQTTPHSIKFSSIISKDSTKVTSVYYNLQPLVITGSGLIGYGDKPYLGFDLQTNNFMMNETTSILSMWKKYKINGLVQANIKGSGDPGDMSAMDYYGTVNLSRLSLLPDDQLRQINGISGQIKFNGNSLETSPITARYGDSTINIKAAVKSLKKPEGDFTVSAQRLYLRDLSLAGNSPDASFKRFNANFTLRKDSVALNSISCLLNSSNFNLSGLYHTGNPRKATIAVTSSKLDLDELRMFSSNSGNNDKQKNQSMDIKLTVNAETGNYGNLPFNKLNAMVTQENGIVYLQNLSAGVFGGKLTANGRIAQGGDLGNRYDISFDIIKAEAENIFTALDISREATGNVALQGNLTARGNNLVDIKRSALGNIRLNMSNGKLKKFNTMSKVFSILNVSQLLKFKLPDMASGGMPYSNIKGSFALKDGILSTKDLFISSNAINISIVGDTDIVKEELNYTIGAQPLQTVDKIVNRIPIVGWLLTGNEKDLLTAYFEAKGKWSDPQVSAIPVKSMSKGILNIFIRAFQLPVKLITDTGEVVLGQ